MTEVIIILGLALILLGPDQLPTIAKSIGKGMREIRKATDDLKSTFEREMVNLDDLTEPRRPTPVALAPGEPGAPTPPATPGAEGAQGATAAAPNADQPLMPPADPAAARAAARRSAVTRRPATSFDPLSLSPQQQAQLRLVPPAGTVPAGSPAAASPSPSATPTSQPSGSSAALPHAKDAT